MRNQRGQWCRLATKHANKSSQRMKTQLIACKRARPRTNALTRMQNAPVASATSTCSTHFSQSARGSRRPIGARLFSANRRAALVGQSTRGSRPPIGARLSSANRHAALVGQSARGSRRPIGARLSSANWRAALVLISRPACESRSRDRRPAPASAARRNTRAGRRSAAGTSSAGLRRARREGRRGTSRRARRR